MSSVQRTVPCAVPTIRDLEQDPAKQEEKDNSDKECLCQVSRGSRKPKGEEVSTGSVFSAICGGWIQIKRGSKRISDREVTAAGIDHWFRRKQDWIKDA